MIAIFSKVRTINRPNRNVERTMDHRTCTIFSILLAAVVDRMLACVKVQYISRSSLASTARVELGKLKK